MQDMLEARHKWEDTFWNIIIDGNISSEMKLDSGRYFPIGSDWDPEFRNVVL
jgi:hypothetical protein